MRILLFVGSIILMVMATPVFAADDAQDAVADETAVVDADTEAEYEVDITDMVLEEVVVRGIRSSMRDAVEIKRSNVGVMEAISAEDFGKFPDGNLAESLARVPGVAIDRSNVEGQKIAVRGFGPEFNLVTLNGRQMPTAPGIYEGGRSFNFGDIASPGVTAVEVFKASNSTLPSGGIGATVNMVTTKPLKADGTKTHVGLAYVEDTTSVASDFPIEATLLFTTNQDNWGFSISGAYQERTNREEGTRESNWLVPELKALSEGYLRVDSSNPAYINNNTREDGNTFYQEPSSYQIKDNDRVRINTQLTFQYAFTDNFMATVDYTYSNVDFTAEGMMFGSWLGGWDTDEAVIDRNGAYTDVVVNNRAYDHEVIWGETENENKSLGLNLEWNINDSVVLFFDAHHSSAAVMGGELNNSIGFTTDNKGIITNINGGPSGIQTFSYDQEFLPENYMGTNLKLQDGHKENEMEQYQLYGTWANEGRFLTSIDFGISRVDNDFSKIRNIANFGAFSPNPGQYDDALFARTSLDGFMNSFDPVIGTNYYYDIDSMDALAAFVANNPDSVDPTDGTVCCSAGPIDDNERVYETLDSAYVQFNMETYIKGMPLDIVAGARYEKSETESISYYARPSNLRWDMIAGMIAVDDGTGNVDSPRFGKNDIILPSLAMSLGVTDNQVVRMSFSKSMARPDLFALSSQIDFGNKDYFQVTANGGNPDLDPLTSNNFDISYENYYAAGSYFAVNYFYKEIKDFIGSRTVPGVTFDGLTDPSQSAIGQLAIECVAAWVDAGRPQTGFPGEPGATGDCVSQQALWQQGWMNDFQHMGWVVNALARGVDLSNGYPWSPPECADNGADGWWVCNPGYLDGTAADPLAQVEFTAPYNMNKGSVSGLELSFQHFFKNSPFGITANYTYISGGDVEADRNVIGEQFTLPGLGDAGNLSVFFENEKHTVRLALNHRGETVVGFANFDQPLYVQERNQFDASYQFRFVRGRVLTTLYIEASNITDEPTRLYVRHPEMLFLSQDHGPIYKVGFRANF